MPPLSAKQEALFRKIAKEEVVKALDLLADDILRYRGADLTPQTLRSCVLDTIVVYRRQP